MFYLGGVTLALFLSLLLISKRNKTMPDTILSVWLLVISIHLLLFYFSKAQLYFEIWGTGLALPLVHGPFLYWYTRTLTNRKLSTVTILLHFLPFALTFLYLIPFILLPVDQKLFIIENEGVGYENFNKIRHVANIISGLLYVTLSSLVIRKHRQSIVHQFSSLEKINLQWLQYLIYWIGAIWVLVIVGNDKWIFTAVVLFILFIGFFGMRQVGIFYSLDISANKNEEILPHLTQESDHEYIDHALESRKYLKSGLSKEGSAKLHHDLLNLMKVEKPFRDCELSLSELASRLNTQPNHLSQVINEREGKNFYDYINTLRIEEFKRLASMPESRKYTLLALAQECGFNSKSSFNRYCKKVTGKSPSELLQVAEVS
jgi:AraC-like DNA-binding protein